MFKAILALACLCLVSQAEDVKRLTHKGTVSALAKLSSLDEKVREEALESLKKTNDMPESDLLALLNVAANGLMPSPNYDDYAIIQGGCEPWGTIKNQSKASELGWKKGMASGYGYYGYVSQYYGSAHYYSFKDAKDRADTLKAAIEEKEANILGPSLLRYSTQVSQEMATKALMDIPLSVEKIATLHSRQMYLGQRMAELPVLKKILESGKVASYERGKLESAIADSQKILDEHEAKTKAMHERIKKLDSEKK